MALQFSITALGSVMLQSNINGLGADVIAAFTIGAKTQLMIVLPAETIGLTMATYCGQNLGARKYNRLKKGIGSGFILAAVYSILGVFVAKFFGPYLSLLFVESSETTVIALAQQYINMGSYFYLVLSVLFLLRNAIQGLGYSITAMMTGVFELIARGIGGFVFVKQFGYDAACLVNPGAWIVAVLFLFPAFFVVLSRVKKRLKKT